MLGTRDIGGGAGELYLVGTKRTRSLSDTVRDVMAIVEALSP